MSVFSCVCSNLFSVVNLRLSRSESNQSTWPLSGVISRILPILKNFTRFHQQKMKSFLKCFGLPKHIRSRPPEALLLSKIDFCFLSSEQKTRVARSRGSKRASEGKGRCHDHGVLVPQHGVTRWKLLQKLGPYVLQRGILLPSATLRCPAHSLAALINMVN